MKYLPILQELTESDTVIFLLIGMLVAAAAGFRIKNSKNYLSGMAVSIILYAICEAASNFHTNFLAELILLFIGTAALGVCIGFIMTGFARLVKRKT